MWLKNIAEGAAFSELRIYKKWRVLLSLVISGVFLSGILMLKEEQPIDFHIMVFSMGLLAVYLGKNQGIFKRSEKNEIRRIYLLIFLFLTLITIAGGVFVRGMFLGSVSGVAMTRILRALCVLALLFEVLGILKSRSSDQRWSSLYILGLAVLLVCALTLDMISNSDLDMIDIERQFKTLMIAISAVGAISFKAILWTLFG